MPLFTHTAIPPLVSLLNASSCPALTPLWTHTTDPTLPEDSAVCLVQDDAPHGGAYVPSTGYEAATAAAAEQIPSTVHLIPKRPADIGSLAQPVVHIQSPSIHRTYIQAGAPSPDARSLGIDLAFLGLQIRPLGERPFAAEVGVVDSAGHHGRIRISSFQTTPTLHYSPTRPPILHLPLRLPTPDKTSLTPWLSLVLHLPTLTRHFSSLPPTASSAAAAAAAPATPQPQPQPQPLPRSYASVTYIRVYASCRVKRIWMSARGTAVEQGGEGVVDEWGMYARRL
ncbi:hypothetical protein NliqN6_0509 [Naganishia liquefaciens]|uniref:CFA20 domain-containing protein n=1 Tax=Naganishia liquefaciens TaxID=104408 RepID=A0A8H3TN06_9TREE|nr:hypothetical protein NliqN6_0509 [Naganishia liquefaciens]